MLIILFIILNNSIILRSYKNYCKSPQFLCQKITPPSTALSFIKDESTGKAYLGNWPGTTMTLLEDNMWTISFSTTDVMVSPKIIFNAGIGGSQTSDFDAVNHGVYDTGGAVVAIPTKSTSIASIEEIAYKIGGKCIFRL